MLWSRRIDARYESVFRVFMNEASGVVGADACENAALVQPALSLFLIEPRRFGGLDLVGTVKQEWCARLGLQT